MSAPRENESDSPFSSTERLIPLLEPKDADLVIANRNEPHFFEIRFVDRPVAGEVLVVGYYPFGLPWFGCFSTPIRRDAEAVLRLFEEDENLIVCMKSERWSAIAPGTPEVYSDDDGD